MNKQGKGKIEWTDWTWNPIKGLCPVGCWYCYARAMYQNPRYGWDNLIRLDTKELACPMAMKKPVKIFVCSTFELFHPSIRGRRSMIFDVIESCPQHTFQILTKMPENIDRPMPDNVWLGVSITKHVDFGKKLPQLYRSKAKVKFISFEPLLENEMDAFRYQGWLNGGVDWIILGRLTGHGKASDPNYPMLRDMVDYAKDEGIPVFLKHNLKHIWPGELVQEWPE